MIHAFPLLLFALVCLLCALWVVPIPFRGSKMSSPKKTPEVKIDIGDLYRDEAEECQAIIAELTSDVRLFACPDNFITKVNRLAEIWGVDHRDKAN